MLETAGMQIPSNRPIKQALTAGIGKSKVLVTLTPSVTGTPKRLNKK